jgi:hypothetical protein
LHEAMDVSWSIFKARCHENPPMRHVFANMWGHLSIGAAEVHI